jgi:tripartite-type tricarboxylate transporter receptor subunit TctC
VKLARRKFLQLAAGVAVLPVISRDARAQPYPTKSIRLVVPFPPGGAFDFVGRLWADKMKPLVGAVVVENIGGGGSSLGAAAVARARPDGYTILLGGTQTHVNEALLKSRPLYDPVKDLDAIADIAANALCIAVHPAVPAQNLKEFIAYAKANPGKLSYGHSGVGSIQHLMGELFKSLAGTPDIVQVPYRGTGPLITDLVSGQVPVGTPGDSSAAGRYGCRGRQGLAEWGCQATEDRSAGKVWDRADRRPRNRGPAPSARRTNYRPRTRVQCRRFGGCTPPP